MRIVAGSTTSKLSIGSNRAFWALVESGAAGEREFGDRGVERRAVVKGHAPPQVEGEAQPVRRRLPGFRQTRRDRSVLRQPGQALEQIAVDHFVGRGGGARGRVQVRRLQRQAQHQTVMGGLGLGLRDVGDAPDDGEGQRQHEGDQAEPQPAVSASPSQSRRDRRRLRLRHLVLISLALRRGRRSSAYVMDFVSRHRIEAPHQGVRISEAGQAAVVSVAVARAASNSCLARAKSAWKAGSAFSRATMTPPTMRPASTSLG